MGIDAVVLLRVKSKPLLRAKLAAAQLPEASVRPLRDGAVLLSTFARYGRPGENEFQLREVLTQLFGADLREIHEDERGVFVFGDSVEPADQGYEELIERVGKAGVWLPLEPLSQTDMLARMRARLAEIDARVQALSSGAELESPSHNVKEAPSDTSPSLDLSQLLRGPGFASLKDMLAGAADRPADPELALGALIVARSTPLPDTLPDSNAVHRLADGTHVIVTTRFLMSSEMIALSLGEEWSHWLSEHHDPRGVRFFPVTSLEAVLASNSYERAIEASEPSSRWLEPRTMQDILREAEERAKCFFEKP